MALLQLQAGFRFDYTPPRRHGDDDNEYESTFADDIEYALRDHVSMLCDDLDVALRDVDDWFDRVMAEVDRYLDQAYDGHTTICR